jgi:hypothetical protein
MLGRVIDRVRLKLAATTGLLLLAGLLWACEPMPQDPIIEACIKDGEPIAFCTCTRNQLKDRLNETDYAVFEELIITGVDPNPEMPIIIRIMDRHGLDPNALNATIERINAQASDINRYCDPG